MARAAHYGHEGVAESLLNFEGTDIDAEDMMGCDTICHWL